MSEHIPTRLVETYRQLWLLEHLTGKRVRNWLRPQSESDLDQKILAALKDRGPGRLVQVERRKDLSLDEFHRVYLKLGIPVIMNAAARDWPCVRNWSPAWVAERYGSDPVNLIDAAPNNFNAIDYKTRQTTLGEVIGEMDEKPLERYSRFNTLLHDHPELARDFDSPWLKRHRNPVCSGQTFQVFIGGKGSRTHLHAASEHNLFTQVYGRKHWLIYPPSYDCVLRPPVNRTPYFHSPFDPDKPNYDLFPAMQYLDTWTCTLEPGDVFFLPPSWWHHVNNFTGSIGVAFRWFAPNDAFRLDWAQAAMTLLAVNPPIWLAMRHRTNFTKIFSYMSRSQQKAKP
ncbi:MAG: cupin-like domain-containing protein [Candidatus Sericytochromatia bacterium]